MAIQGATDDILKVIRDMSIESRPPGPVSAFIKIPKQVVSMPTCYKYTYVQNTWKSREFSESGG